jgi:hypothetical protein
MSIDCDCFGCVVIFRSARSSTVGSSLYRLITRSDGTSTDEVVMILGIVSKFCYFVRKSSNCLCFESREVLRFLEK